MVGVFVGGAATDSASHSLGVPNVRPKLSTLAMSEN